MKLLKTTTLLLSLFLFSEAFAQLDMGVQIRPRGEFRNGFKTLTTDDRDPAFFIEQRSRFFVNFKEEKLEVRFNLQDIRIWGSTNQIYKTDLNTVTNIYEAWGKYDLSERWWFKIGRMPLDYNNARFLGNLDWAAQGRSHDLGLIGFQSDSGRFQVHFGAAFNQVGFEPTKLSETYYFGVNNYLTNQFIWIDRDFGKTKLSALIHNDGRQVADSSTAYRQTYGLIGSNKGEKWTFDAELFYQGGKNQGDIDVSAYLISATITYKTKLTPIAVGVDYLSGTDANNSDDESFNPLYGTNHKFYGYMDYFYVGNAHGQNGRIAGLQDIYLKTNFKLGEKSKLKVHAHHFSTTADIFENDLSTEVDRYLGSEIDLVYHLQIAKHVGLDLGYSHMFASESMEFVKGAAGDHQSLNNWAWFMINFNPNILHISSKKLKIND